MLANDLRRLIALETSTEARNASIELSPHVLGRLRLPLAEEAAAPEMDSREDRPKRSEFSRRSANLGAGTFHFFNEFKWRRKISAQTKKGAIGRYTYTR